MNPTTLDAAIATADELIATGERIARQGRRMKANLTKLANLTAPTEPAPRVQCTITVGELQPGDRFLIDGLPRQVSAIAGDPFGNEDQIILTDGTSIWLRPGDAVQLLYTNCDGGELPARNPFPDPATVRAELAEDLQAGVLR